MMRLTMLFTTAQKTLLGDLSLLLSRGGEGRGIQGLLGIRWFSGGTEGGPVSPMV